VEPGKPLLNGTTDHVLWMPRVLKSPSGVRDDTDATASILRPISRPQRSA